MSNAQYIKESIDTKSVFEYYGFSVNKAGFAKCPFHSEKTASCKVYDGARGYHCFGCGESGDIITFVQKNFGVSFNDAQSKLNEDFLLGLPIGETLSREKKQEIAKKKRERENQRKAKEKELEAKKTAYYDALDEVIRLERQMKQYAPKNEETDLHPLFIEAITQIEYAKHALGCADEEWNLYEQQNNSNT